jgi:hypothetical protein
MIPDVAVQYRCGDNIGFGKTRYGLLPFAAIVDRIPKDSQTIYVVADSPTRQAYHPYTSRCGVILEALFKRIKAAFPNALVVIKRGGDLFLDVARLTHSKVLICSASTFCLWPAIANQHAAHYPLTPLVGRATNERFVPQALSMLCFQASLPLPLVYAAIYFVRPFTYQSLM